MGILSFLGLQPAPASADALYGVIVQQARQPAFYVDDGVPDTVAGRFDMITLHAYIVMRRLNKLGQEGGAVSQSLFDTMFLDMDRNMREMGVGDIVVGKRIKALAISFYGRIKAYEVGLADSDGPLAEALDRNVFAGAAAPGAAQALANYLRSSIASLGQIPLQELMDGRLAFAPAPATNDGPDLSVSPEAR